MKKHRLILNLQLFAEDLGAEAQPGVDNVPAAEEQAKPQIEATSEPGAEQEVVAEPEKQNNFEKAFAKRLAAKEAEWEAKNSEKYKDYDTLKKTTTYFQQRHGYTDLMSMNEDIELAELQDRAARENVPAEVLKRIDQLEAEAAEGKELKQQQQQNEQIATYFKTLEDFTKDKGVDPKDLNQFMLDNEMQYNPSNMEKSFNIALKAMKADEFEKKAQEKETDTINRYLASKQAPRVEGSTGAASTQSVDTSKMGWKDLEKHAAARLEASKTPS